jgi:RES domain-containing protein
VADGDQYERIDSLGSVPFSGIVYRHVGRERDCLSGDGARNRGGRWNPPNSFPTLYTALTELTAAAEFRRLAEGQNLDPIGLLPRKVCRLRVALSRVVDLRSTDHRTVLGLELVQADDLVPFQQTGRAVHQLGLEGLLAPSATGVGEVLIIYQLNLDGESRVEEGGSLTWRKLNDLPT